MNMLHEHMNETADIMDGYTVGRLFVDLDAAEVGLQDDQGRIILLTPNHFIDVRNGEHYEQLTLAQVLAAVTTEGWPGYAGLYGRIKLKNVLTGGRYMKTEELKLGERIRIKEGHASGYGGRTGRIMAIEVTADIGEPLLIRLDPKDIEPAPDDLLPPGWEEVNI